MRVICVIVISLSVFVLSCKRQKENRPVSKNNLWRSLSEENEPVSINTIPNIKQAKKLIADAAEVSGQQPEKAITIFNDALNQLDKNQYPEECAIIYNNLASCYQKLGNIRQQNYYQNLMYALFNKIPSDHFNLENKGHQYIMWAIYAAIAEQYFEKGNYDSATLYYTKVLEHNFRIDTLLYPKLAYTYIGLGAIASKMYRYHQSLDYFDKADSLAILYNDADLQLQVLSNKATLLLNQDLDSAARIAAEKALRLAKKQKKADKVFHNASTIAISYFKNKNAENALPYSQLALDIAQNENDTNWLVQGYNILGTTYLEIGDYDKAKQYLTVGYQLAERFGSASGLINASGQLSEIFLHKRDYKKAYEYRTKYSMLQDSLRGQENAARIAAIEAKYNVAQKDKKLAELDKSLLQKQLQIEQHKKQQIFWIGGGLFLLLAIGTFLLNRKNRIKLNRIKAGLEGEEKERTRLARELHDGIVSRLSILKMNFSSLPEDLVALKYNGSFDDLMKQLEDSISELRNTSHNLLPDALEHIGLEKATEQYVRRIRKIAFLDFEFLMVGTLPELEKDAALNIYRVIQELVNNILKHSEATKIFLQYQIIGDEFLITLDAEGTELQPKEKSGSGIGYYNLQTRLNLLHGKMEIESHAWGRSTYLSFNLKKIKAKKQGHHTRFM